MPLPPYATLLVFAIPGLLLLSYKLAGLWLLGKGHVIAGGGVFLLAKTVGLAVTAFLFETCKPKLMQLGWFARLDIPDGYLCPSIPGRADYIHYMADVLASFNHNVIPLGKKITGLDIGIGANAVYPILAIKEYNWNFIGPEAHLPSLEGAQLIADRNPSLHGKLTIRRQYNINKISESIIHKDEFIDLVVCNPPFHHDSKEAHQATMRKLKNLSPVKEPLPVLNFGGKDNEVWRAGGEVQFAYDMIRDSQAFATSCFEGEWLPNRYGGRENLEAIELLRELNIMVHAEFPGALTLAEESTAWPGVSRPTYVGGLGFSMKWNMGWMHDTLTYMRQDPVHRRYHQDQLTFSQLYAYSENFVLPFSHDEVVHGKGSLWNKMPGDAWQKFANVRLLLVYQMTWPGEKLNFMGNEFAQQQEWRINHELDWYLLGQKQHTGIEAANRDLNHYYKHILALHQLDLVWTTPRRSSGRGSLH